MNEDLHRIAIAIEEAIENIEDIISQEDEELFTASIPTLDPDIERTNLHKELIFIRRSTSSLMRMAMKG